VEVKVSYSAAREKTVSLRLEGDVLFVSAPSTFVKKRLDEIVERFKARVRKRKLTLENRSDESLAEAAFRINKRYFDGRIKINSIEYSSRQRRRYGSCDHRYGKIRISSALNEMPRWVRDYVIAHEMAHILEPNHGRGFYELLNRYPLAERARGYLMAAGRYAIKES